MYHVLSVIPEKTELNNILLKIKNIKIPYTVFWGFWNPETFNITFSTLFSFPLPSSLSLCRPDVRSVDAAGLPGVELECLVHTCPLGLSLPDPGQHLLLAPGRLPVWPHLHPGHHYLPATAAVCPWWGHRGELRHHFQITYIHSWGYLLLHKFTVLFYFYYSMTKKKWEKITWKPNASK